MKVAIWRMGGKNNKGLTSFYPVNNRAQYSLSCHPPCGKSILPLQMELLQVVRKEREMVKRKIPASDQVHLYLEGSWGIKGKKRINGQWMGVCPKDVKIRHPIVKIKPCPSVRQIVGRSQSVASSAVPAGPGGFGMPSSPVYWPPDGVGDGVIRRNDIKEPAGLDAKYVPNVACSNNTTEN